MGLQDLISFGQSRCRILPQHYNGVIILHNLIIMMIAGSRVYHDGVSYHLYMTSMHSYKCKINGNFFFSHYLIEFKSGKILHELMDVIFLFIYKYSNILCL